MSLKAPDFETLIDAKQRLEATVVLYDNEPVYISRVVEARADDPKPHIFRVVSLPLPLKRDMGNLDNPEFRKFISSKNFDLSTIPLGFLNYKGQVFYCSRVPRRQYRQGISENTLNIEEVSIEKEKPTIRLSNLVYEQVFVDMIKGKYPTFEECVGLAQAGGAAAFGRTFAVVQDEDLDGLLYLYHKTEKVGFIYEGKVKLAKKMKCLVEMLKELGIHV